MKENIEDNIITLKINNSINLENDNINNNLSFSFNNAINNPIVSQLVEFGFNQLYSTRLLLYYHPNNIEEALDYLNINNGIMQHHFVQERENNNSEICYLCGEKKEIHLDNNENITNEIKNSISFEISNSKKDSLKKTCDICGNLFNPNEDNTLKQCGHSFCNECWYDSLTIKIKENKIPSIKCLDYECQEKLSDYFIIKLLKSNQSLIKQYKKLKLDLEIVNDPNKKFCPSPNCDSYLELKNKNNKNVKCKNGHNYCFNCLEKPHNNSPCKKILNTSLLEFSKSHFIKKCPNCSIITEKIEGCNHITCSKCNYQWCWLCDQKYDPEHYLSGKCKGFQFFKPKNENDIKLAMEGKIVLNASQRQIDTFDELNGYIEDDFNRDRNRVRNIERINRRIIRIINEPPSERYRFKWGKITRSFLLFIYIIFGQDIIILDVMDKNIGFDFKLRFFIYIIFYLPYKIAYFFWLIYLNIILLIPFLIKEKFMNFTSLIYDLIIFRRFYPNLRIFTFQIYILFFSLFCLSITLIYYIGYKCGPFGKTFTRIDIFIGIILIFAFFPIQFYINIGMIIFCSFYNKFKFKDIIKDINNCFRNYKFDFSDNNE